MGSELGKQTEVWVTHDSLSTATVLLAVMLKIIEDLGTRHYTDVQVSKRRRRGALPAYLHITCAKTGELKRGGRSSRWFNLHRGDNYANVSGAEPGNTDG